MLEMNKGKSENQSFFHRQSYIRNKISTIAKIILTHLSRFFLFM